MPYIQKSSDFEHVKSNMAMILISFNRLNYVVEIDLLLFQKQNYKVMNKV